MAEIKIEKKKSPIWPWVLLGLLLLALLYFFVIADDDDNDGDLAENNTEELVDDHDYERDDYDDVEQIDANTGIAAYKEYIQNPKMGLDHEYSNGALLALISAVRETANQLDVDVDADLEKAKAKAEDILEDPYEVDHANKIRNSGEIIVNAIQSIQTAHFPELNDEYEEMNETLMKIKPDEKTLNQKDDVQSFFDQAADLLTEMKN